jgi:PII-like signaling protein
MMIQAQFFIDKDELFHDELLSDFVLRFLLDHNVDGATVFVGRNGFGKHQKVNRPNDLFSFDETPLLITFVDEKEKMEHTIQALRQVITSGFLITHPVTIW